MLGFRLLSDGTASIDQLAQPDLYPSVLSPRVIDKQKRSAEHSDRLKSSPFRSAMSMLTFYLNRGGKNLSAARKRKLEAAKVKLREAFGRKPR